MRRCQTNRYATFTKMHEASDSTNDLKRWWSAQRKGFRFPSAGEWQPRHFRTETRAGEAGPRAPVSSTYSRDAQSAFRSSSTSRLPVRGRVPVAARVFSDKSYSATKIRVEQLGRLIEQLAGTSFVLALGCCAALVSPTITMSHESEHHHCRRSSCGASRRQGHHLRIERWEGGGFCKLTN